ncbi:hypothetical protein D3C87_1670760 [compost metagenome]
MQALFVGTHIVGVIHHVYIVEAVVRQAQLGNEFECRISLVFCTVYRVRFFVPWVEKRWSAKWVQTSTAECMPVSHRKAQVLLHCFAGDNAVFVIPAVSQWVVAFRAFERDLSDTLKILLFSE